MVSVRLLGRIRRRPLSSGQRARDCTERPVRERISQAGGCPADKIDMPPGSWLVPTELDRARVVDAHGRMRRARVVVLATLGLTLLITLPWNPWWVLVLLLAAAVPMLTFELRLKRSAHPERLAAQTLLVTLLVLAIGAAGTGGPDSPGLPWLVIPCAMAATRFRATVVAGFAGLTAVAVLAVSVPVDPSAFRDDPRLVSITLALLVVLTTVTTALTT